MVKLRPLSNRIVVSRIKADEVSPGGIVIPDAAREKGTKAEVLAVGPGKLLDNGSLAAMSVKPGDVILFGKYSGTESNVAGTEILVLSEDDVLGVIIA